MPEAVARGLLVAAAAGVALAVALLAPRWSARRAERAPLDLSGIDGRVVLFTSRACRRCDAVRDLVSGSGVEFTEVCYEDDGARFAAAGVGAVPLLVARDERGTVAGCLAGAVRPRRLRGLLEASGVVEGV
jgi:glutaredoxin